MINITKPYKEDVLIPISVSVFGNELNIDVYEEFLSVAREYERNYIGRYFSDEALSFLAANIEIEGYVRYDDATDHYLVFSTNRSVGYENELVCDIENAEFTVDNTEFEAEVIREQGEPASLIVKDGKVASIAAANYFVCDDDDEVELAVETLPEYRGKGYAKAVLCHMTDKMLALGKTVTYRTSAFNAPSIATALSCGFVEIGKEYYFNCYKEEE